MLFLQSRMCTSGALLEGKGPISVIEQNLPGQKPVAGEVLGPSGEVTAVVFAKWTGMIV